MWVWGEEGWRAVDGVPVAVVEVGPEEVGWVWEGFEEGGFGVVAEVVVVGEVVIERAEAVVAWEVN